MFADRRQSFIAHKSDASVALAMQHRKVGKYTEARTVLEDVLAVDPGNGAAKRELGYLDDPIRTNPALTYEHTQNIDKVRRTPLHRRGQLQSWQIRRRQARTTKTCCASIPTTPPPAVAWRNCRKPSPTTIAPPTTTPAPNCCRKWTPPGNFPFPPMLPDIPKGHRRRSGQWHRGGLHHRKTPPHHHSPDRFR